jgi:hypothetical protein
LEYIESSGSGVNISTGISESARWELDIAFNLNGSRQLMGYSSSAWMYWGVTANNTYEIEWNVISGVNPGARHTIVHDFVNKKLII